MPAKKRVPILEWCTLGALIGLFYALISKSMSPSVRPPEMIRENSLRAVAGLVSMYVNDHSGRIFSHDSPSQFLEWVGFKGDDPLFGDADTQDLIWICPLPEVDDQPAEIDLGSDVAELPMLHERVDANPNGTSVAFWDGSVRFLTNEEFEMIIDESESVCLGCELGSQDDD